ncbi:MAG TPA: HAMP domain-containing sensor histidine kinase [Verrucomicrobiae bacterium]|nr:HAMP domain-containing sensor histidine kinase [Verrucomicrobiae bacterium]
MFCFPFGPFHRRFQRSLEDEESCGVSWHDDWHRRWAERLQRQAERRARHFARHAERQARHFVRKAERWVGGLAADEKPLSPEEEALRRARRRAGAEAGFYAHLVAYLSVIAFLALINLFTSPWYPWFLWPAFGWGIGLFSHYMAVFGSRALKERFFDPAVERELRRERATMQGEKQASIDELSSSIAHEIRNPIAAAKSLVQQMGEDPTSVENVEYAKVAIEELDRVEHRVSHLLKYAKEEDMSFALVNLATVVDSALTQLRAKLDAAKVAVSRNYIGGPTVQADADKLRGVFVNVIDNAIDALASVPEGRRIDLFLDNGAGAATVRVRDNGSGIPADKLDRIFNPFFTTKDKGTGLGMAIAKKIVEAHEGTIDVVSEAGRGTEFKVTLPLPAKG